MFPVGATASPGVLNDIFSLSTASNSSAKSSSQQIPLGLLTYSFGLAQKVGAQVPGTPNYTDPLVFIQEAAGMGADAVQIPFGVRQSESVGAIRTLAEKVGITLESTLALPQTDSELPRFEAEMRTLQDLGVGVTRTVVFPGRRYEDLHSYSAYQSAVAEARGRIRRAEPIARKHRVRLAIENHKDQRIQERLGLLKEFESEYVGACVDVGNNLSLLEDPVEVSSALAPYALTVHFKDQGLQEYEEGFLLADVPLGRGCIDLVQVIRVIRARQPKVHFQLELITRDPLKVPVLTEGYWATFPGVTARELARTWESVRGRNSHTPFPQVSKLAPAAQVALERGNIEESFRFAAEHLSF